jgi:hypothetical protein
MSPYTAIKAISVRFSEPAMPVSLLLEALSKQTRIVLVCAPEVRSEILLLHVQDVALHDVMDRIAEVAGARWRNMGNAWQLERPDKMARTQQEQDIQARSAIIAQKLKHILSPLQKPWNADVLKAAITHRREQEHTGQVNSAVDHLDPVYRTFLRCLSDVLPVSIARIPAGGREVFATEPTPMQKPLGRGAQIALAKLDEEQRRFGTTLRNAGMNAGFEDNDPNDSFYNDHTVWNRLSPYRATPVRSLLILERKWKTTYEAQLILLDKDRRTIVDFRVPSGTLDFDVPWKEIPRSRNSPVVPLSARSRILCTLNYDGSQKIRLSSEALLLLTMPEKFEPLSMAVSDGYLALAHTKKRNLIAALPDALFLNPGSTKITRDDVLGWPNYETRMRIVDRNGWLVITPPYPYEARLGRVNREMLGRIVRRIAQHGSPRYRIEDSAEFAANGGDTPMYHFGNEYIRAISEGEFNNNGIGNWTLLALYGALTTDQQKSLRNGQTISFKDLTNYQRRFAHQAVFGARYNYSGKGTVPIPKEFATLFSEPTEGYPNGLLGEGTIHALRKSECLVYFLQPGKTENDRRYWVMQEQEPRFYSGPGPGKPVGGFESLKYEIRYRTSITVEVDVTPWFRMGEDYHESNLPPANPPVLFSKLSPDIQKRVQKELDFIRSFWGEPPIVRPASF